MKNPAVCICLLGTALVLPRVALAQNAVPLNPREQISLPGRPSLLLEPLRVVIEEVAARRSAFEPANRLDVHFQIQGIDLSKVEGFRCTVAKAVDDTGADLRPDYIAPGFDMLAKGLRLKLPVRSAQSLKELSGSVELLMPDHDPDATIDVKNFVGKPRVDVSHPTLAALGAKLSLLSKREFERVHGQPAAALGPPQPFGPPGELNDNSVIFTKSDPHQRILDLSFCTAAGEPIFALGIEERVHRDNGVEQRFLLYHFNRRLPETSILRVVLVTPKSIVTVPFSFANVLLP